MDLIITDVTDMSKGHVCIAGWDVDQGRMVRPLHVTGHYHWDENQAHPNLFHPGNVIRFTLCPAPASRRGAPHAAEDTFIQGDPALVRQVTTNEMVKAVKGSVFPTIADLFGHTLTEKKFVPDGTGLRSLGAIELPSRQVRFYNNDGKFSCWFIDANDEKYSIKITSHLINRKGIDELSEAHGTVHIRLGLANAWDGKEENWNPRRCYVMVNGVFIV